MELPEIVKKPLDDLYQIVAPRFKNPFLGAFMISWILINWQPLLFILFASYPIEVKIAYVVSKYTNFCSLVLWPFGYAIFYAILFPYLSLWMEKRLLGKYTKDKANMEVGVLIVGEDNAYLLAEKKLQTAKKLAEVQAQESTNKTIAELSEKLRQYEEDLTKAATERAELAEKHIAETTTKANQYSEQIEDLTKKISLSQEATDREISISIRKDEVIANLIKLTTNVPVKIYDVKLQDGKRYTEFRQNEELKLVYDSRFNILSNDSYLNILRSQPSQSELRPLYF